MRTELLECPALPAGYSVTVRLWQDHGRPHFNVAFTAPGSHRTVTGRMITGLEHATQATALNGVEVATREHLERFTALYPASVRNRITTWLGTLTKPAANEQQLF